MSFPTHKSLHQRSIFNLDKLRIAREVPHNTTPETFIRLCEIPPALTLISNIASFISEYRLLGRSSPRRSALYAEYPMDCELD